MKVIKEDIFNSKDIIVNQVNCLGVMEDGLSKKIKEKYPEVFNAYYHYCKTNIAEDILGTSLICEVEGKYIANVFGQINYGTDKQYTDYDALQQGLKEVRDFAIEKGLSIAIPYKIGCDFGGGDWNTVSKFVRKIFSKTNADLYK